MYLWRSNSIGLSDADLGRKKSRYIITFQPSYDDAYERVRQVTIGSENLRSIDLIGFIPGITGTSSSSNPSVYYIVAAYVYPRDPSASSSTRRIVTDFFNSIDSNVAAAFEPALTIGPIATGPTEAVDVGKFGVIVALLNGTAEEARRILIGQVFHGQIEESELNILNMTSLSSQL